MVVAAMVELMGGTIEEMTVEGPMKEWKLVGSREWTADEIPK